MKSLFKILSTFFIILFLTSCTSTIVKTFYIDRSFKKAQRLYDSTSKKEVIIFPMCHFGTKEHYEKVKKYLDEKKNEGFVTFYEGVSMPIDSINQPKYDILRRKARKIVGCDVSNAYDSENNSNRKLEKIIKRNNYTKQTKELLGLTTPNDIHVDLSKEELISLYEKKHGEVILTKYDMETDFNEYYNPPKNEKLKKGSFDYSRTFRDDHLTNEILNSKYKKIIVVYGENHKWSIYPDLIKNNFTHDESFSIKKYK